LGKHLLEVEDLLQKHGLLEADISAQTERVQALNAAALKFSELEGNVGTGTTRTGRCSALDGVNQGLQGAVDHLP